MWGQGCRARPATLCHGVLRRMPSALIHACTTPFLQAVSDSVSPLKVAKGSHAQAMNRLSNAKTELKRAKVRCCLFNGIEKKGEIERGCNGLR